MARAVTILIKLTLPPTTVCVCACVCVCVRACVRACVRVCVNTHIGSSVFSVAVLLFGIEVYASFDRLLDQTQAETLCDSEIFLISCFYLFELVMVY